MCAVVTSVRGRAGGAARACVVKESESGYVSEAVDTHLGSLAVRANFNETEVPKPSTASQSLDLGDADRRRHRRHDIRRCLYSRLAIGSLFLLKKGR